MEKVGIVFGCFIPLHDGHKHLIEEALRENDKIIIAVCGYDSDRGKDFIPFSVRYDLMRIAYEDDNIFVVKVDDHKIGLTGLFDDTSWRSWGDELFSQVKENYNMHCGNFEFTWYTGELSYVEKLSAIYTKDNFKYFGRQAIKVSGTKIRENYDLYKHRVDDLFRRYIEQHGIR